MTTQRKRIFVVDDEPATTRMLKLNLELTGDYEVLTENSPHHALAAAERFKPDFIVLDVLMPNIDGGELAAKMRANSILKNTPIVFLTAAITVEEARKQHYVIGGDFMVGKPVAIGELINFLREHMP